MAPKGFGAQIEEWRREIAFCRFGLEGVESGPKALDANDCKIYAFSLFSKFAEFQQNFHQNCVILLNLLTILRKTAKTIWAIVGAVLLKLWSFFGRKIGFPWQGA